MMAGTVAEIAVTVLVPLLLGVALLRTCGIRPSDDPIGYPGWAWVGGALMLGLVLLVWMSCGLPIRREVVVPCLLTLAAVWLVAARFIGARGARPGEPRPLTAESMAFGAVLALALLYLVDRALLTNLSAALGSDEAFNWASKAKLIFDSGGFGGRLDQALAPGSPKMGNFAFHADYPLFNPLMQLWSYITTGAITHTANRVPIQVFDLALVLATAAAVRRRVRPGVAAVLVILFMGQTWPRVLPADADRMVACALIVGLDGVFRWYETHELRWLAIGGIGLAALPFSKNEGLLLAGSLFAAVVLARFIDRRAQRPSVPARAALSLLPVAATVSCGVVWKRHFGFANDLLATDSAGHGPLGRIVLQFGDRAGPVLGSFARDILLDPHHGRLMLLTFLVLCALTPRACRGTLLALVLFLVFAATGLLLSFIASPFSLDWHWPTAGLRVFMHLNAAAALGLSLVLPAVFPNSASTRRKRRGAGGKLQCLDRRDR